MWNNFWSNKDLYNNGDQHSVGFTPHHFACTVQEESACQCLIVLIDLNLNSRGKELRIWESVGIVKSHRSNRLVVLMKSNDC